MPHSNIIAAVSEDEINKIITDQLLAKKDNTDYTAQFTIDEHTIVIDIDFHPDNAEENANGTTLLTAPLAKPSEFRFSLTKQDLTSHLKKLFGMQDVIVGNAELDRKFIIKTNDEAKIIELLSHPDVAAALLQLPIVIFEIRELKIGANKEIVLTLDIEGRVTESESFRKIITALKAVLHYLN